MTNSLTAVAIHKDNLLCNVTAQRNKAIVLFNFFSDMNNFTS